MEVLTYLSNYDLSMYGLPFAIALIGDGIEIALRCRLYKKNTKILSEFREELGKFHHEKPDYGFVLPMYRNPEEIGKCLEDLMSNLGVPKTEIIAIDDYSNDKGETKRVAEKYGIQILEVSKEEKDVRKIRAQRKGAEKWLERGKKYTVCLDTDCYIKTQLSNLELAMVEMDFFDLDAMAAQVLPKIDKDSNLLERIQYLEYKQAMRAEKGSMYSLKEHSKDEVTNIDDLKNKYSLKQASQLCISGAFGIFKSSLLKEVLDEMKFYGGGEDVELTQRCLAKKAKIGYHNSIIVETKAPDKLSAWFRQRNYWSQFISSYSFDSEYVGDILKKKDSRWKPNYDAGGSSLRIQMLRDVYGHPVKLASFPFLVTNLPLLTAFMVTYFGLNCYNSIRTKEKGDKGSWSAGLVLPFYRIGQLLGPMTVGYAKQFSRMLNLKGRRKNKLGVVNDER